MSSPSASHCYELCGRVSLQPHSSTSSSRKSSSTQTITTLGRDSTGRIVLRLRMKGQTISYLLQKISVHHKFAKSEGKGSIVIPSKQLQIIFSNCPPDKLNIFLKTLEAKLKLIQGKGQSLASSICDDMPVIAQDLSPLNIGEISKIRRFQDVTNVGNNKKNMICDAGKKSPGTPKSSKNFVKRNDKENALISPKNNNNNINKQPLKIGMKRKLSTEPLSKSSSFSSGITLSEEQKQILRIVAGGTNLFFTGSAGTGKSLVLRKLIGILPSQTTAVTAATGVAACHISGTTIHSFCGIGCGSADINKCCELASRKGIAQLWKKTTHLIIDEISMIHSEYFDKIEQVARYVRGNDKPFGGIQLILCGDFLQLPPVTKSCEEKKFCFQSDAWNRCMSKTVILREVRRQNDQDFIRILHNIRIGRCPPEDEQILMKTKLNELENEGIVPTKLCTHKDDVNIINQQYMQQLTGECVTFNSEDSVQMSSEQKDLGCLKIIKLKVGAQVLLTKNLSLARNLSNGSRGVVQKFVKGLPEIRFASGATEIIGRNRFIVRIGGQTNGITRLQLPLQLAWAISIHKSQGMSLDCVEMSLSRVFEDGQAYVALSRARGLQGLRILDFTRDCVRANPRVIEFYRKIMRQMRNENIGEIIKLGS